MPVNSIPAHHEKLANLVPVHMMLMTMSFMYVVEVVYSSCTSFGYLSGDYRRAIPSGYNNTRV